VYHNDILIVLICNQKGIMVNTFLAWNSWFCSTLCYCHNQV